MLSDPSKMLDFSNYLYGAAALLTLFATFGVIYYGRLASRVKDAQVKQYQTAADERIAKANSDAETAKANAAEANARASGADQKAEEARLQSAQLRLELAKQQEKNDKANAALTASTTRLDLMTQGIAQQQQGMARQMQAVPTLNDAQIEALTKDLSRFSGQHVALHMMVDTPSQRLGNQIAKGLTDAGITIPSAVTEMGIDVNGVVVAVHEPSPAPHPRLADEIVLALRRAGLSVSLVGAPKSVGEGETAIFIGPAR